MEKLLMFYNIACPVAKAARRIAKRYPAARRVPSPYRAGEWFR
jgi:hypothetical protein